MPKLPRYVFRRANGSFRYKRNVPKELREIFGKDTLYRQLGNTVAEALKEYPYVHARIEALLENLLRGGPRAISAAKALIFAVAHQPAGAAVVADTAARITDVPSGTVTVTPSIDRVTSFSLREAGVP